MNMWMKIRKPKHNKKMTSPRASSLPETIHILPTHPNSWKYKIQETSTISVMGRRDAHPEVQVPSFSSCSVGRSVISSENRFPKYRYTSWESIEDEAETIPRMDSDDGHLLTLTNGNEEESRQDSLPICRSSSVDSEPDSFLEQPREEAPQEAIQSSVLSANHKHHNVKYLARNKYSLRPKLSVVRKWNRYADMEEKGLPASPRHKTKLGKALHFEQLAAVASSFDSNEENFVIPAVDPMPAKSEDEATVDIEETCVNRDVQVYEDAKEGVGMPGSKSISTTTQSGCTIRDVQDSVILDQNPKSNSIMKSVATICKSKIQRITENGFPASVLHGQDPAQVPPECESKPTVTMDTVKESEIASASLASEKLIDSCKQDDSMGSNVLNKCDRQEEIVTLSLAQILVQSYQPDPDNPGYWKKKIADHNAKKNAPMAKSFVRKDAPLPPLNIFLQEVKARRNEIFTKGNDPKTPKAENKEDATEKVDWYGVKRDLKETKATSHRVVEGNSKDMPNVISPNQKRVVVCKPCPASANDLLSELKAKQQEFKIRSIHLPEKKETEGNDERGTGFLPDLMTELKAKQREIERRQPSRTKVEPANQPKISTQSTGSTHGHMKELKAKQRAIEDRFYKRLENLQSGLRRGNKTVVIPKTF